MPIKIVRANHFELLGEGYVLLTAPHASEAETELYTGKIVEDPALSSRCYAVVGKLGPEYQDPYKVQTARAELRSRVEPHSRRTESGVYLTFEARREQELKSTFQTVPWLLPRQVNL